MLPDELDAPIYALVSLDQRTEEQQRLVSNDYASLVNIREMHRAAGWQANVIFAADGDWWDALRASMDFLTVADIQQTA